jgi:hypothetical protein
MGLIWNKRFCYLKNKINNKTIVIGISNLMEIFGNTEFQILSKMEITYFPETGRFSHYYVKMFSRLFFEDKENQYSQRCPSNLAFFTQLESLRNQIQYLV